MASAHLTGTTSVSRPSAFEIISQQGFANALKPAASHVIKVLAERDPGGRFAVIYRYFDEFYLTFDAIIQWHYILTRGATLSEAFYGLERQLTPTNDKVSSGRISLSYLTSVVLPYVSSKIDHFVQSQLETETITDTQPATENGRKDSLGERNKFSIYTGFLLLYPRLKAVLRATNMFYFLSYTFGYTVYHSLTFKLLRMSLRYTSEERYQFVQNKNAELWDLNEWKNPKKCPKLVLRSLGESVLFAVEIGTFFIQFLEWWYNDDRRARVTLTAAPVPPPPRVFNEEIQQVQNLMKLQPYDMNKCPICRASLKNPTAISVSGVVYCYGCIFNHLKQEKTCPLTKINCNVNHLIRVYQ